MHEVRMKSFGANKALYNVQSTHALARTVVLALGRTDAVQATLVGGKRLGAAFKNVQEGASGLTLQSR